MKRCFILFLVLASFLRFSALAQTASTAAAIAEKQDTEERFKRMSADLESLQSANTLLQKKLSALDEEMRKLREEQTRAANNSSAQDDLKRLAEKIQEVDKKRADDRDLILAQLKKLGETLSAPAPRAKKSSVSPAPEEMPAPHSSPEKASGSDTPEKGFSYKVEDGDTLGKILAAYNAEFKSKGMKTLTQKQVSDANPNVNWNRLRIGQKIFIPAPAPAK